MLQPQGRKLPFESLDLASLRHKRLALPRQIGLKGRQSVPLLGGERLCLSETGRELVDSNVLARNESTYVVTFLCGRGEFGRSLRQGALKCSEIGAAFAHPGWLARADERARRLAASAGEYGGELQQAASARLALWQQAGG